MEIEWNPHHIGLETLIRFSRSDKNKMYKYLFQFQELIPLRVIRLKESLEDEDRKMIRQILHQMSPQLQFFEILNVAEPIRRLEYEYETMPIEDLKSLVNDILIKLDRAIKEIGKVLKNNFE